MIRPLNPLGVGPQLDIAEQEVRLQDVLDRQEVWGRNEWTNCSENFYPKRRFSWNQVSLRPISSKQVWGCILYIYTYIWMQM